MQICLSIFFFPPDARSVLCNDPDMYEIPVNIPVDTVKLRIEKTVIRRIPTEAFYYLVDLKYLWVTYNCVANIDISSFYNLKQLHELRLDGNLLSLSLGNPWRRCPTYGLLICTTTKWPAFPLMLAATWETSPTWTYPATSWPPCHQTSWTFGPPSQELSCPRTQIFWWHRE